MQIFNEIPASFRRLKTREVKVGNLLLGNSHPIRMQTMTTTDTLDTVATVEQSIRCIQAGAELIRITAPSKREAENLANIKKELRSRGFHTPIVADIHFTPNAAEIAARIVEKVRINPGNYIDKKKFELIEYNDSDYAEELDRIRERVTPLFKICKEYGTALRIGTNHGSLSDRIMSRYGDTPIGMVESAMEFLRVARDESFHNIVLSMKSSNPMVVVQAYRLLIKKMFEDFGECYPLHLGVTEAGDAEDGRIKSAVGIGSLLEEGIGDTIRVSLTEDPELEIPVCNDLLKRYRQQSATLVSGNEIMQENGYDPFQYKRRETFSIHNMGGKKVPIVIADLSKLKKITRDSLNAIGYHYKKEIDKWNVQDRAADYIYSGSHQLDFEIPGTLGIIINAAAWTSLNTKENYYPLFSSDEFITTASKSEKINFVMLDCANEPTQFSEIKNIENLANNPTVVLCLSSEHKNALQAVRKVYNILIQQKIKNPVINLVDSQWQTVDEHLIHFSIEAGALLLDGLGDGVCFGMSTAAYHQQNENSQNTSGRNYSKNQSVEQFINDTAFGVLQATRTRISKTEYISCPSCGRTLFDLQETTAKIRSQTHHLKGVKIAIMGCIVNGPGEMADADFGYVGSGVGKITLYKGKEIMKRNINSDVAVTELINLLKEDRVWVDPQN